MIAVEARICPFCGKSALVNLVAFGAVADGRKRYRLARSLSALGPGASSLVEVQQALASKDGVVAKGVSRAFATRAFQVLEAEGVPSSVTSSASSGGRSLPWGTIGVTAACVALFAIGIAFWRRPAPAPKAVAAPGSAAVTAPVAVASERSAGMSTKEIAARALPATVSIRCSNSVGSGFFVSDELVLTNAHVLCPGNQNLEVVREVIQPEFRAQLSTRLPAHVDWISILAAPLPLEW